MYTLDGQEFAIFREEDDEYFCLISLLQAMFHGQTNFTEQVYIMLLEEIAKTEDIVLSLPRMVNYLAKLEDLGKIVQLLMLCLTTLRKDEKDAIANALYAMRTNPNTGTLPAELYCLFFVLPETMSNQRRVANMLEKCYMGHDRPTLRQVKLTFYEERERNPMGTVEAENKQQKLLEEEENKLKSSEKKKARRKRSTTKTSNNWHLDIVALFQSLSTVTHEIELPRNEKTRSMQERNILSYIPSFTNSQQVLTNFANGKIGQLILPTMKFDLISVHSYINKGCCDLHVTSCDLG